MGVGNVEEVREKRNPLENSGIELMMLEHGRQFRSDMIERTQCLKLLVAVTILTCPSDEERAETMHKWIQIAVDAKTAVGNLFAFSSIMLGLSMPQVRFFLICIIFDTQPYFSAKIRYKNWRRLGISFDKDIRIVLSTSKLS